MLRAACSDGWQCDVHADHSYVSRQDRLRPDEHIHWEIFADNAPVQKGSLSLQNVPWTVEHGQKRAVGRALFSQSSLIVYALIFFILLMLWLAPTLFRFVRSGL